jgi:hypothetical protein
MVCGLAAAGFAILSACGPSSESGDEAAAERPATPLRVTLTKAQIERLGVRTTALAATAYEEKVQGFGAVVRFDELAQAAAEVETSQAAARQSASALTRARKLNDAKYVSGEALDAAKKQAETDQAQLALAQRKESVAFGRQAPWRTPAERNAVLASLAKGEKSLVRVTFPSDAVGVEPPVAVDVQRLATGEAQPLIKAETVWAAPADATMPGRSFFVLINGGVVAEGERLLAFAGTAKTASGVVIPDAALVMSEGQMWCYVAEAPGAFARRAVGASRPVAGGYFVSEGFKIGEAVVTQGQSLLLAYEINPEGGEEE